MLLDVADRKAGSREFCGCRQARDSATDNEDVEDLYATYDAIQAAPSDLRPLRWLSSSRDLPGRIELLKRKADEV